MALDGLNHVFIELTNRCDKKHLCSMCGRQKGINEYGEMYFPMLARIAKEIPAYTICSFHRNGEPTAYPMLGQALSLFSDNITSLVTHGLNLVKKANEIIDNCTTVVVSRFETDPDRDEQLRILKEFLALKGNRSPQVIIKYIGVFNEERLPGVLYTSRSLHSAKGSKDYKAHDPVIPESGVCLDLLSTLSIDWNGEVYMCNRNNSGGSLGFIADNLSLESIWNGVRRQARINSHKIGDRNHYCNECDYWGCPTTGG